MRPAPSSQSSLPFDGAATVREDLRRELLALNYHAFAQSVALLLERIGYSEVRLAGRTNWRGANGKGSPGGYDLSAVLPAGPLLTASRRVIVQAKQFDSEPIFQKAVDQLRGVCLRVGAAEALIVTTGQIAPSVRHVSRRFAEPQVAPVRLVDGDRLLDLLIAHRIGVWSENDTTRLGVDLTFFEDISRSHPGNGRGDYLDSEPRFLVKVEVEPIGRRGIGKPASVNVVARGARSHQPSK